MTIYTASSFRNLHAVRLFHEALRTEVPGITIHDWTEKAAPSECMTPSQRREWFDTEQDGGQVYDFCRDACQNADLVVYLGAAGQDAGVEVGMAATAGVPVLGIRGPLEAPGLMLHGAVSLWVNDVIHAVHVISHVARCDKPSPTNCQKHKCGFGRICPKHELEGAAALMNAREGFL